MLIEVNRDILTENSTTSIVLIDGRDACYFLEDTVREIFDDGQWLWTPDLKIYGKTAIPSGRYKIIINDSARFKKPLPLLLSVPNFSGVRIHPGNVAANTEGCPLPGTTRTKDRVNESTKAFNKIFPAIDTAFKDGDDIFIKFNNVFEPQSWNLP